MTSLRGFLPLRQTVYSKRGDGRDPGTEDRERWCAVEKLFFRDFLAREYDLSPEAVEELLQDARSTLMNLLRDMKSAAAVKDWKNLSRNAHQLKGILGYLGLRDLQDLARSLEKIAASGEEASASYWQEILLPGLRNFLDQMDIS